MNMRIGFIGIAALVSLVIGTFMTAIIVALVSMEPGVAGVAHAVTREQAGAVIVCLIWQGLGYGFGGMWFGYRLARLDTPPAVCRLAPGWLPFASVPFSFIGYMILPAVWISHYQPNFYWWFVFSHIVLLFLVMVIAISFAFGRAAQAKTI